LGFGCLASK